MREAAVERESGELRQALSVMSDGLVELTVTLGLGLAIREDQILQAQLRALAGVTAADPLVVSSVVPGLWLEHREASGITYSREEPQGVPGVDFDRLAISDNHFKGMVEHALNRTQARERAIRLLNPLFRAGRMPSREEFSAVNVHAPLLEQVAFKYAIRGLTLLDAIRPGLQSQLRNTALSENPRLHLYWSCAHSVAYLLMIAASPKARPWLAKMAGEFVWGTWTPSFPLLRERTVWLAAAAARAAIAFGPSVVEPYFSVLASAESQVKVFDALFGLVAIALDEPPARSAIQREIARRAATLGPMKTGNDTHLMAIYSAALAVLDDAERDAPTQEAKQALHWPSAVFGFATPAALRMDPLVGRYVGFAILPLVCSSRVSDHFPIDQAGEVGFPEAAEMAAMFRRAWATETRATASVLH